MKKIIKLVVVTGVLLVAGITALTHSAPAAVASSAVDSPASLYRQNCARCHGANGRSQTALGRKLDAKDITGGIGSAKVIRAVTNGRGDMPSFRRKLSPAQIRSIASYVSSL